MDAIDSVHLYGEPIQIEKGDWIVRDEPDSWRAQWCVIVDGKRFVAKLKIIEQKSKPNCLPGGICVTGDRWQVV